MLSHEADGSALFALPAVLKVSFRSRVAALRCSRKMISLEVSGVQDGCCVCLHILYELTDVGVKRAHHNVDVILIFLQVAI